MAQYTKYQLDAVFLLECFRKVELTSDIFG